MLDVLAFLAGLALTAYAADVFVVGAARLARMLQVSPVVIGAILIGFGTSAPELLVTSLATLRGAQDLAIGNVVGSNSANILLVVGAAAAVRRLPIRPGTERRELVLMLAAVILLALVAFDLVISTFDAVLLLVAAVAALASLLRAAQSDREAAAAFEAELDVHSGPDAPRVGVEVVRTVAGLVGTVAGAQLLVVGAEGLALLLGMSEAAVGVTVVAVGTSLPELVTAVAAARRDEPDLVVGNVLGSNLFNSLPIAGIAGLLDTSVLDPALGASLVIMLVACGVFAVIAVTRGRVERWEGAVLLLAFVIATALTVRA